MAVWLYGRMAVWTRALRGLTCTNYLWGANLAIDVPADRSPQLSVSVDQLFHLLRIAHHWPLHFLRFQAAVEEWAIGPRTLLRTHTTAW